MIIVQLENIVDSSFSVNTDQMTIFLDVSAGLLRNNKKLRQRKRQSQENVASS